MKTLMIISFALGYSISSFAFCPLNNNGTVGNEPIPFGCVVHSFQSASISGGSFTTSLEPKCNYTASEKCSRVLKCTVQRRDYCNKTVYRSNDEQIQSANINLVCQDGYQYGIDKNGTKDICQLVSRPLKNIHILEHSQPRELHDHPTH